MPVHDIVVVGGSAGSVEATVRLVQGLPADFPASVFVVIHTTPNPDGMLPWILSRKGPLPATEARDGEAILGGHIYVAPPDRHLTLQDGTVRVSLGPKENRHRPAIDPLFRSAAHAYGPRVVGVILSGMQNDGTAGLLAVERAGGVAIVQDPSEALFTAMPRSALLHVKVEYVLPAAGMGAVLSRLASDSAAVEGDPAMREPIEAVEDISRSDLLAQERGERRGTASVFTCPDCGGILWQADEPGLAQFRCLVGHTYTGEELLEEQAEALERALWSLARGLEERRTLARQLGRSRPGRKDAERLDRIVSAAERHLGSIREIILRDGIVPDETRPSP